MDNSRSANSLLEGCDLRTPTLHKLTNQKKLFVLEFFCDPSMNGKEAAIRAGYSKKSAAKQAAKLLADPRVKSAIDSLGRKLRKKYELKSEDIIEQLYYCVMRNATEYVDQNGIILNGKSIHDLPEKEQQAIDGIDQRVRRFTRKCGCCGAEAMEQVEDIKTKLKLVPKAPSIELAMKHQGLFSPEQHTHKLSIDLEKLVDVINVHKNTIEGKIQERLEE